MPIVSISLSLMLIALFGLTIPSNGQGNQPSDIDYKIQVGVEEVRLDAVVLDRKGRQITDLSAEEFEIYQNGNLQVITSARYINEYQSLPEHKADASHSSIAISQPRLFDMELSTKKAHLFHLCCKPCFRSIISHLILNKLIVPQQ
jgi:hypothetical protein